MDRCCGSPIVLVSVLVHQSLGLPWTAARPSQPNLPTICRAASHCHIRPLSPTCACSLTSVPTCSQAQDSPELQQGALIKNVREAVFLRLPLHACLSPFYPSDGDDITSAKRWGGPAGSLLPLPAASPLTTEP